MNAATGEQRTACAALNTVQLPKTANGPFAQAPIAPLAAGVLAHNRWALAGQNRGPFADWQARND